MVELKHGLEPIELTQFLIQNPSATVSDFNNAIFFNVKQAVRVSLHQVQGGLCAYCESHLSSTEGQVDHIKPKGGTYAHPHLCFQYTNYAYSCINPHTCGQKKKSGLLPIEPAIGCNAQWTISTDGTIEPLSSLNRSQKHNVIQTRDMLGLNKDPELVDERKRVFLNVLEIARTAPDLLTLFLASQPFRYIISSAVI